jgi:hypothetical protein
MRRGRRLREGGQSSALSAVRRSTEGTEGSRTNGLAPPRLEVDDKQHDVAYQGTREGDVPSGQGSGAPRPCRR